jgi:hypothetical protein
MDTKLTLSLDKIIIEQAKTYAKTNKVSLSKLIESYLASLTNKYKNDVEITPLVKSLSGVISLENDVDTKSDYTDFLIEKYK